jgi:VWFA-related protein
VDVTVTGKNDDPVAGLRPEDFEVTEDGTPVKVDRLEFIRLDGSTPAGDDRSLTIRSTAHAEQEAARDDVRVFAIFLDDYHVLKIPAVTLPARRALTDFVNRLWPTDLVALMEPLTPLSALRFTRSRSELLTAINSFQGRYGELFPVKSPVEEAQWQRGDVGRVRAEVTLSALAALTVRLGSLREGRKTIIFISQGPPTYFGTRSPGLQDRMQEIAQAASRGNVTIYTLDPAGLGMEAGGFRDTLYQLAAETGGRAMVNTNDPTRLLDRIFGDSSAYYVLGYTPPRPQDDGRYHKISVKVKRPGTRVLARQGYWSPDPREVEAAREAAARTPEPSVAKALENAATMEPTKRPVDLWLGWSKAEGSQAQLRVTWDPAENVSGALLGARAIEVEVLDAQRMKPVAPMQSIAASGSTASAALRQGAVFVLTPGAAGLKVTVRGDEGGVLDSWTQPLTVPDFSRVPVALSSIRFYRARTAADLRTLRAAADPMPLASRRFSRTDRVLVAVDTYVTPGTPVTLESHVLARDGRELAPLPLPAPEGITTRFELPLSSLGQGTYLLRIRAKTAAGFNEQVVAFRVGN